METLSADGLATEDMKSLAMAFSRWENRTKKDLLMSSKQTLFLQRSQKYKSAIQTLNQSFNPTKIAARAFDKWKSALVLQKMLVNDSRIPTYGLALARLMPSSAGRHDAAGAGGLPPHEEPSTSLMPYQDQKLYQKLNSFMLIKQLLLTQYIQRGTVLQKYIGMLKYLAQEQARLQGAVAAHSRQSPPTSQRSRKRPDSSQTSQSLAAAAL